MLRLLLGMGWICAMLAGVCAAQTPNAQPTPTPSAPAAPAGGTPLAPQPPIVRPAPQPPSVRPAPRPPVASPATPVAPVPQQPAPAPVQPVSTSTSASSTSADAIAEFLSSPVRRYVDRMPEMLGDFGVPGPLFVFDDDGGIGSSMTGVVNAPVASGMQRVRIGDFNQALPRDRIFASYHHFHNVGPVAVEMADVSSSARSFSVNRWVVGAESTFEDGRSSIEARLPLGFVDGVDAFPGASSFGRVSSHQPLVGNLSLILKRIGAVGDLGVLSYGLGLELPTGGDGRLRTGTSVYEFGNDVVHLSPFVAVSKFHQDRVWFGHGFFQVDVPLGSEPLAVADLALPAPSAVFGHYTDPVRLLADLGIGRQLATNRDWTLSALGGLHLASDLASSPTVISSRAGAFGPVSGVVVGRQATSLNSSFGFHLRHRNNWYARCATSLPLSHRYFDSELIFQLGRNY
ncbi:MAG: hypothetical protein KDB14_09970 [Planctomycetales bacterium]|nr:hypothetical protein [Planctomycetales bacterium]